MAIVAAALWAAPAYAEEQLSVFAAASLTDAFKLIGKKFEARHPGLKVRFNFGASNMLSLQIEEGAACDVFASASEAPVRRLRLKGLIADTPFIFCTNRLAVAVPEENHAGIRSWKDIARPGVKLVMAAAGVPAGDYAREILRRAGIEPAALRNLVSNEPTVRAALAKVALGEADAGIVFVSDAKDRRNVSMIEIPDTENAVAEYPVCILACSRRAPRAANFKAFLFSDECRSILESYGFSGRR